MIVFVILFLLLLTIARVPSIKDVISYSEPVSLAESALTAEDLELSVNFPSFPNLSSSAKPVPEPSCQAAQGPEPCSPGTLHYSSLQCVHCNVTTHLTTTDSGSICIKDLDAASKLLNKFGHIIYSEDNAFQENCHILNFDESNIKIGLEWNALQQQLILRHVSGDASRYKNLCQELISTII